MAFKKPNSALWADIYCWQVRHAFRRAHHYAWGGQCYQKLDDMLMHRLISEFISLANPAASTAQFVKAVVETIAQKTAIPSEPPEPLRLDACPAQNAMAFSNGVLLIDEFIEEQLNEPALLPAP
jgi:hypothetical protein